VDSTYARTVTSIPLPGPSSLYVIETDAGAVYLGAVERKGDLLYIYTGRMGRPPVIPVIDVEVVVAAEDHPDVEWL